jgi:hypothetical protein
VIRDADLIGEPRFSMLEMIREYGLDGLDQLDDLQSARDRMASWVVSMSEAAARASASFA